MKKKTKKQPQQQLQQPKNLWAVSYETWRHDHIPPGWCHSRDHLLVLANTMFDAIRKAKRVLHQDHKPKEVRISKVEANGFIDCF